MDRRPGTPSLLRELNDRAALELLLTGGPLTRAQLGEHTGLSKVTASQLLSRLEERGLVTVAGELAGGRGPNAALYAVVPSSAYVAGMHVERDEVSAGVADITGRVGVGGAVRSARGWPVTIENDVNLAAMAERAVGAAAGFDDFVLVWVGVGVGLATILGGRLHRGVGRAAGEIGYLPVPGVPLPEDVTHPATGAFQSLIGGQAVPALAAEYGFEALTPDTAVTAAIAAAGAGDRRGSAFVAELAL